MGDCLQDMLSIYLLEMINFTPDQITPSESCISGWHLSQCCQIYLTELNFAVLISACSDGCYKKQPSKLCSWIYCWDGVQNFILWIKKCFLYENPREKFFAAQQNENFKQRGCFYLVDNMDLLTVCLSPLTWVQKMYTQNGTQQECFYKINWHTFLRGGQIYSWIGVFPIFSLCPNIFSNVSSRWLWELTPILFGTKQKVKREKHKNRKQI